MVRVDGAADCSGSPNAKERRLERNESPQIEIRLNKGMYGVFTLPWTNFSAKNIAEEQIPVFRSVLASSVTKNWRSLHVSELSSVSHIASNIFVGSLSIDDGEVVDEDWTSLESSSLHFYRPNEDGGLSQELSLEDSTAVAAMHWQLPSLEFEGIWENLIFEDNTKNEVCITLSGTGVQLMSYVYALIRISEKHVNTKILNVNRLILLVGSPGTGKTSLCKGLAHHLSIRLSHRYPRCIFVEVNSHSLFSKWFSESGKLVQKMFDDIEELAADKKTFVFVLIDEAESLCMSREAATSRNEPTDAVRAVNAVLTQIDRIRRLDNVLVLATSNLVTVIDSALLDRADFVKVIGRPSVSAIKSILSSCISELQRIGLVETATIDEGSMRALCTLAQGLSARALRQVPVVAYAKMPADQISMTNFLSTLRQSIEDKLHSQKQ